MLIQVFESNHIERSSVKKLFIELPSGSALYVVLHGKYRRSRGKKPSCVFGSERDPRKAYRVARLALRTNLEERIVSPKLKCRWKVEALLDIGLITSVEMAQASLFCRLARKVYP